MSDINFKVYPQTNRIPGVFQEVDATQSNTAQPNQLALLIGQMLPGGTYTPNVPVISTGIGDVHTGAGQGSMLAQMLFRYRKSDTFREVWLLPLADAAGAVAATGSTTITGPATGAGTIALYLAGRLISVAVSIGDTATVIGANVLAAMALIPSLPVSASNAAGVITFTALHKGLAGNDIDIGLSYLGPAAGQVLPAGVAIAITPMSGGTTNPSLTAALANIAGNMAFDFIALAYTDPTSLNAMQSFLDDNTGRWSWQQQLFGGCFAFKSGSFSVLDTTGLARNDRHMSILGAYGIPTPPWECAADYTAAFAVSSAANPATPLNTTALTIMAPPVQSRFTNSENNSLLYAGISTLYTDDSNTVRIQRAITTYQTAPSGAPDNSFLNVERMYTLQFMLRDMITYLKSRYSQSILVPDGTRIQFGSGMTTAQLRRRTKTTDSGGLP
ncbi:MAG: hypothetical protein QOJ54_3241 [Aliidongia sp.]|jgi:phage tail sheath gpL-like|nr:hypothetical protein [Aliidongia sp.]